MNEDELPKLPPLEEVLRNARKSVSKRAEKLPLPELLRQLSEYVSAEDLKRLMERPEPSYVPEPEPFPQVMTTNCSILYQRKGYGKISLVKDNYGQVSVACEYIHSDGHCMNGGPEKCPFKS
jgi:hypothetical protein